MATEGGLTSLRPLTSPRGSTSLARFEEELIDHLSKLTAALDAESLKLAKRLDQLDASLERAEDGVDAIDVSLRRMQASGVVRMTPLDHSKVSLPPTPTKQDVSFEASRNEPPVGGPSFHQVPQLLTKPAGFFGDTGLDEGDMASISWALRHVKLDRKVEHVTYFPESPIQNSSAANGATTIKPDDPVLIGDAPQQEHLGASIGDFENTVEAMEAPLSNNWTERMSSGGRTSVASELDNDSFEPSASAVRGFRALLEAALRDPESNIWDPSAGSKEDGK